MLTESINISTDSLENSALTQEQINKLDETTRILLADYQSTSKEYESLKLYNDQVQKIINSQIAEIENILFQIDELDKTNQKIVPLMIKMINGLEDFINLDLPFLMKERQDRLANLRSTMDRGDISTSEKFRLITEAYKTELEYGRTIETYRDTINIDGVDTIIKMAVKAASSPEYGFETSDLITNSNREKLYEEWSRFWDNEKEYLVEKSPPNITKTRFLQEMLFLIFVDLHQCCQYFFHFSKSLRFHAVFW